MLGEAIDLALELLVLEGGTMPASDMARRNEGLEMILAEWLPDARARHEHHLASGTEEQRAKWAAKRRDGWRCVRCGSTTLNAGTLHSHHIVPRGARGDPLYSEVVEKYGSIDAVENLATLCGTCHVEWAHAGWRRAVDELRGYIGGD